MIYVFEYDLFRREGKTGLKNLIINILYQPKYTVVFWKRMCEHFSGSRVLYVIVRAIYERMTTKYGFDCGATTKIGPGFLCSHLGGIAINNQSVIGNNVEILQGVTIGVEKRGRRIGAPLIGNNVWIGSNVCIVGNVKIGNNVMIAANSFVNFDVPSNSIVIGNPAMIKPNDNATYGYMNFTLSIDEINNLRK